MGEQGQNVGLPGVDPSMLKTEERILYAAMKVFAKYPFGAASIRMIAGEANVNLSSVMYHFRSKDHLYEAVFERLMESHNQTLAPFFEIVDQEKTFSQERAEDLILQMIAAIMDELYSSPEKTAFAKITFLEYYFPSPLYDSLYDRYFKKNYEILVDLIMAATGLRNRRRGVLLAVHISGQMIGFRMERQYLKRNLGLLGYTREEAGEIKEIVLNSTTLILENERKRNF